jgi:hypothetical protein
MAKMTPKQQLDFQDYKDWCELNDVRPTLKDFFNGGMLPHQFADYLGFAEERRIKALASKARRKAA